MYKVCKGVDVIVYYLGVVIGYFVVNKMNILSILVSFFLMILIKDYLVLFFYDWLWFGKIYNKLMYCIFEWGFWKVVKGFLKKYWV